MPILHCERQHGLAFSLVIVIVLLFVTTLLLAAALLAPAQPHSARHTSAPLSSMR
jgi:hypothetical protein